VTVLKKLSLAGLAAASLALGLAPDVASARHRHYYHRHYSGCHYHRRANVGTVVGGVGGGLVGNAVTHGSFVGTVVGAGAGAVVGHQVGKHSC